MTPSLMLQGTCSHAGKSLITAGLCRALARRGLRVRPFKPQNMSNNAAVTADGGEIGRAQALQARAALTPPSVDMNPVLLKPESDRGAQVVVRGRVIGSSAARDYHALKPRLMADVLAAFERLGRDADLVLVEGAGSPAEVNLRDGDIANMGFALRAGVPVALIGDIDRGGVIASLVGTMALLEPEERALVRGYVINKLRGDPTLLDPAHAVLRERTGLPSLGVVPWLEAARLLPQEDALGLDALGLDAPRPPGSGRIRVVVPRLARIANFDDLDPLIQEPLVEVAVVPPGEPLPVADLVLLPGTKATLAELEAFRGAGWDIDLQAHVRRGGAVLGICGGLQMLGTRVADPDGIEGRGGEAPGLGLLDLETTIGATKTLVRAEGVETAGGEAVRGYLMHMGRSSGTALARPMLRLGGRPDGAVSPDGRVMGCHLHGLFASDGFRRAFLARLDPGVRAGAGYEARIEGALDALALHLERHLDLDRLQAIAAGTTHC
jgi:adenosylcobyric acid synthase